MVFGENIRWRKHKKNKRANVILDTITILIVIFVFAIASIVGLRIFNELNADFQNDTDNQLAEAKAISGDLHTKYPPLLDNLILFAFTLLVVFTLVSVFMLDTHPIFFIITVLLLVGVFVVAIILGNAYDDVMQDAEFSAAANQFTYTTWLMTHVLELFVAVAFILVVALFIKFRSG